MPSTQDISLALLPQHLPTPELALASNNNNFNQFGAPQQLTYQQTRNNSETQYEQLGCGFDLLTQTCKDVFQV